MYKLDTVGDACRELYDIQYVCSILHRREISRQIMIILGNEVIGSKSHYIISTENNHPLSDAAKQQIAMLLPEVWPIVRDEAA